jgi:hypothetical protein
MSPKGHCVVSNSEMSSFFDEQGRTRVFVEAYTLYSADGNPRRTLLIGKGAIYGWTLITLFVQLPFIPGPEFSPHHLVGRGPGQGGHENNLVNLEQRV